STRRDWITVTRRAGYRRLRPEKPPATRLGDWTATVDLTIVSTRLTVDHVARGTRRDRKGWGQPSYGNTNHTSRHGDQDVFREGRTMLVSASRYSPQRPLILHVSPGLRSIPSVPGSAAVVAVPNSVQVPTRPLPNTVIVGPEP